MQNNVTLISLDQDCEESTFIKKGNTIIECFDFMGKFWPIHIGLTYKVDLELQQLDPEDPELIYKTDGKLEKKGVTYEYLLYGYVKDNIFYVKEFEFDFSRYNDFNQYNNKFIKFKADRINIEFLEEFPSENNSQKESS